MEKGYIDENGELQPFERWKTPYNHDTLAEAIRTGYAPIGKSLTQQNFRDDADINVIVARVIKTGIAPDIPIPPQYGDLTTADDYHTMLNKLAETKGLFYRLDAEERSKFNNDPGAWLGYVNQAIANGDLEPLREMGMDVKAWDIARAKQQAEQDDKRLAERKEAADKKAASEAAKAAKSDKT